MHIHLAFLVSCWIRKPQVFKAPAILQYLCLLKTIESAPLYVFSSSTSLTSIVMVFNHPSFTLSSFPRWYLKTFAFKLKLCDLIKTEIGKLLWKDYENWISMLMNKNEVMIWFHGWTETITNMKAEKLNYAVHYMVSQKCPPQCNQNYI